MHHLEDVPFEQVLAKQSNQRFHDHDPFVAEFVAEC